MKRLLATLTLILYLSFPVFAGHVLGGGYGYCSCDNPESHLNGVVREQEPTPDSSIELSLVLEAVLMYLKARA